MKNDSLKKRLLSSAFLIAVIFLALTSVMALGLLVAFFVVVGLYEFFTMLEKKGINIFKYVGIAIGVVIPLSIAFEFEPTKSWELLFIVLVLLILILMQFNRRQTVGVVVGISTTVFGILYVSWFLSFLIKIRMLPGGLGLLATVLIITKFADIGAYLIGTRFGKTPLIPRISPNKSVEGAVGGIIFSVLGAWISGPFLNFNYFHLAIMGACFGVLGQLGDLSESLMKRDCQVKDSGVLFPGIGGVLDSIDSLLFTAPVFYFYISALLR
jgi:phosphatidate cytidylyltransferase